MGVEYGADQIQILKDWRQFERDPECISEAPLPEDFIIWFMRLWIIPLMKRWQDTAAKFP